jgi:hypothetical protein
VQASPTALRLTWRQFRAQALAALAILAAVAIYFLITGLQMHHAYSADLATCTPNHDCIDALSQFGKSEVHPKPWRTPYAASMVTEFS